MEKSAGLVIIYNKKILLVHPTGNKWKKTYSIPKGKIEDEETPIDAAIRETFEETGILVDRNKIVCELATIDYKKDGKKTYKKVFPFLVFIDSLEELNLKDEVLPKEQLSLREVDWAGFVGFDEFEKVVFPRMSDFSIFLK